MSTIDVNQKLNSSRENISGKRPHQNQFMLPQSKTEKIILIKQNYSYYKTNSELDGLYEESQEKLYNLLSQNNTSNTIDPPPRYFQKITKRKYHHKSIDNNRISIGTSTDDIDEELENDENEEQLKNQQKEKKTQFNISNLNFEQRNREFGYINPGESKELRTQEFIKKYRSTLYQNQQNPSFDNKIVFRQNDNNDRNQQSQTHIINDLVVLNGNTDQSSLKLKQISIGNSNLNLNSNNRQNNSNEEVLYSQFRNLKGIKKTLEQKHTLKNNFSSDMLLSDFENSLIQISAKAKDDSFKQNSVSTHQEKQVQSDKISELIQKLQTWQISQQNQKTKMENIKLINNLSLLTPKIKIQSNSNCDYFIKDQVAPTQKLNSPQAQQLLTNEKQIFPMEKIIFQFKLFNDLNKSQSTASCKFPQIISFNQ